jgi:hypothetical protein
MHGPTGICRASLTPLSPQTENNEVSFEISDLAVGDAAGGSGSGSGGEQAAGGSGAAPTAENAGLGPVTSAGGDGQQQASPGRVCHYALTFI